ncbi:hypothetical protein Tco_0432385 [Tanacetum coccineum]
MDTSPSHPSPPPPVVGEMHKEAQQAAGSPTYLGDTSEDGAHPQLSSDESEEEENAKNDKDTEDTSVPPPSLKSAQIQELMAQPSYPDINQLTELLVTSLKPELSKLLALHDFASCLPTELKELPSKITELFGEIKELKQHIKDMKIKLPGDLKEIYTKLETFTSTISSLLSQVAELKNIQWELSAEFLDLPHLVSLVQEKLKTLDSLPGLLNKVTNTLNRFATLVGNASGATTTGVPSADKASTSPVKGENDVDTNLKNELVDLLGIDIATQEDGTAEFIEKFKANDLQLAEWREVVQACPDRKEKG